MSLSDRYINKCVRLFVKSYTRRKERDQHGIVGREIDILLHVKIAFIGIEEHHWEFDRLSKYP